MGVRHHDTYPFLAPIASEPKARVGFAVNIGDVFAAYPGYRHGPPPVSAFARGPGLFEVRLARGLVAGYQDVLVVAEERELA